MRPNSLEKCVVRSPDGRYRAHIATVYYISRPPLSQNPIRPCNSHALGTERAQFS